MARDRTQLSNERTFLSYVRTSLGLVGAAIIIFRFATQEEAIIFGPALLVIAALILFWGVQNYRIMSAKIKGASAHEVVALVEAHDL